MELFKLAAKLTLDSTDFNKGVRQAESAGKELAGKMSAMTIAAGNLIAKYAEKTISAVTGLFKSAYNGFADYEQLIGGVETLFKDSANTVRQYAMQSFKTTGLSANEYMRTITSFSASLMQGLKGDTAAAAKIANMAMVDMADNANKMGTDMASIQNAYMGFAKQNYTMLDNLKLGYGGTAKEMIRLINDSGILEKKIDKLDDVTFDQMIQAIHVIQGELGITGTTAEEAEHTISGSFASLKASFMDALTAIGSGDMAWIDTALTNFKDTFKAWLGNAIPNAIRTLAGMDDMAQAIVDAVVGIDPAKIQQFLNTGLTTATGLVQAGRTLARHLIDTMGNTLQAWALDPSDVRGFSTAIGEFFGTAIHDIVVNAPDILGDIISLGSSLAGGFVEGLFSGLFGSDSVADQFEKNLDKEINDITASSSKASAILNYMDKLITDNGEAATKTELWAAAVQHLEEVLPGAGLIIGQHKGDVRGALQELRGMNEELKKTAIMNAMIKTQQEMTNKMAEYGAKAIEAEASLGEKEAEIENAIEPIKKAFGKKISSMNKALNDYLFEQYGADSYDEFLSWVTDESGNIDATKMTADDWRVYNLKNAIDTAEKDFNNIDFTRPGSSGEYGNLRYALATAIAQETGGEFGLDMEGFAQEYDDAFKQVETMSEQARVYRTTMDENQKSYQELDAKLNEFTERMSTTIDNSMLFVTKGGEEAGKNITEGGGLIHGALVNVAAAINSIEIPATVAPGYAPKATGLEWVPYDGFRAELHRGERILTAAENAEYSRGGYRGGMDYDRVGAMIGSAINEAMGRIGVYLGAEKVADMTSRRTGKNIRVNSNARLKAMGG